MATGQEYTPRELILDTRICISPVPHYSTALISHDDQLQVIFEFTGRRRNIQWIMWRNSTKFDGCSMSTIELRPKTIQFNPPSITSTQKERMFRALNQGLVGYRLSMFDRKDLARRAVEEAWDTLVTRRMSNGKLHLHIDFHLIHSKIVHSNIDRYLGPVYNGTSTSSVDINLGGAHQSYTTMVPNSQASIESLKNDINIVDGSHGRRCSICLEDFVVGCDNGVCLPCFHMFHGDCITRWLSTSRSCPLCRFQMPTST